MTLATLNFIHSVLEHEEEARKNAKKLAYQARNQAEEEGAENLSALRETAERAWKSWSAASDALHDFEAQEW